MKPERGPAVEHLANDVQVELLHGGHSMEAYAERRGASVFHNPTLRHQLRSQ